jgi:protein O-GlcNAc transferase
MFNRLKNLISHPEQSANGEDSNNPNQKPPAHPDPAAESVAQKEQGDAHLRNGDLAKAKANYQHAIALNPNYAKAHSNLGFVLKEQENYADAERSLKTAIDIDPTIADAHYMLGTISQIQGKPEDATRHFGKALELDPDHEFACRDLCYVLFQLGKIEAAKEVINNGIARNPGNPAHHFFLGNLYLHTRELDKAASCFRTALSILPAYVEAHFNLGLVLQEQGKLSEAVASYKNAISFNPDFADAHYNLGVVFFTGQHLLPEAESSFRRVLEINPEHAEAHYNLGNVLKELHRLDEAEANYRHTIRLKPDFAEAHSNLGNVLKDLARTEEAIASYRRALQIRPDLPEVHNNLGVALGDAGRLGEAEACYRRALQLNPKFAEAHINLGFILQNQNRLDEAEASYRQALQVKPEHADAHNNLASALRDLNRLDEAEASYRRAIQFAPDHALAHSGLLFLYSYHAYVDPHQYLAQARKWELACLPEQDRQAASERIFLHPPLAGRRLRVGYVSADFRQHAVSHFIEQLFTHHDRTKIELFAYYNNIFRDEVTGRLQALTEHWILISGMSDAAVRDRIEADGIDVLIDLSGHTSGNRLGVFARRAAPVQAYYLGYFASTGLTEMDYWIGDEVVTPPETDSHFSEQVWRLPRVSWSYDGKDAPPPNLRPAQDDTVWVGSFNQLGKLTPATLALWAKILLALPEGRLLLKTKELADDANRQRILDAMTSHGISPDRIELKDISITPNWQEHMAYYNRLDIVLDPVGAMGGVTSTCDALWMGAPVITLEGDRVVSRATAAILTAIGHPEWIARSDAEYIDKVAALARNVDQRNALRTSQRNQMARSPLCDAKGLAMSLESAYVEMFEKYPFTAL